MKAETPAANLYGARAREVMEHIQKTFWNAESGLYIKSTADPSREDMWGNGVIFSALVGAARHEPAQYVPVMEKFFNALDAYWDAKGKVPGYEPLPTADFTWTLPHNRNVKTMP